MKTTKKYSLKVCNNKVCLDNKLKIKKIYCLLIFNHQSLLNKNLIRKNILQKILTVHQKLQFWNKVKMVWRYVKKELN